jgi:hypothetical protein
VLKFFYIFISLQLATGNLFGNELAKTPFLFAHFQEHKLENESLSLLEFLHLHYDNPEHHEQDHEKHHHLPLQHSHQVIMLQLFDFQDFIKIITFDNVQECTLFFIEKISPLTTPQYCQAEVVNRLLRPPNR